MLKAFKIGLNLISIKKGELCHFILKNNYIEILITEEQYIELTLSKPMMWPKIMSSIKLSFFNCYFPLWQHNRYFKRCNIKTGPTRSCCLEPYPAGFWASPRTAIPQPLWAPLLLFTLTVKSHFPLLQLMTAAPCLVAAHHPEAPGPIPQESLAGHCSQQCGPPSPPSPGGTDRLSGFSSHIPCSNPRGASAMLPPVCLCLSGTGLPKPDTGDVTWPWSAK